MFRGSLSYFGLPILGGGAFFLSLVLGAPAAAKLSSDIELGSSYMKSEIQNETANSFVGIGLDFKTSLNPNVDLQVSPFLSFYSGYIQSDLYRSVDGSGKVVMKSAFIDLHDQSKSFYSKLGVIRLSGECNCLLSSPQGSSGLEVGYRTGEQTRSSLDPIDLSSDQRSFFISAQLQVPNSYQQSYSPDQESKMPQVFTASTGGATRLGNTYLRGLVTQYTANNLSESIAEEANQRGNSILYSDLDGRSEFENEFSITSLSTSLDYQLSASTMLTGSAIAMVNTGAPEGLNRAYQLQGGARFGGDLNAIEISYSFFYIEPDAAISAFNSVAYETNRVGRGLKGTFIFNPSNHLSVTLSERNVIYAHPFQQHEIFSLVQWTSTFDLLNPAFASQKERSSYAQF